MSDATTFELLRPLWLWGFVPLALAAVLWWRRTAASGGWERVVDAELAPYVVESGTDARRHDALWLFVGWALALVVLAGPVFERQPVPVFEARRAQVVAFDLSRSMLATDVAPDRLTRARYKLGDLIERADGTRTGLVGFAERPYVISPLTDDAATLEAFLPSLSPAIVPAQGSRPDLAIERAVELLEQAGDDPGHVILITDAEVGARELEAARALAARGHVLSVLGVGTAGGTPLRDADGQFVRRADGDIVVPQLSAGALRELAGAGGGVAVTLSSDASDLDALARVRTRVSRADDALDEAGSERYWIERAPWLLPPLALLALALFRRGVVT